MKHFDTSNLVLDQLDDLRALREGDPRHLRVHLTEEAEKRISAQAAARARRTVLLLGGTGFAGIHLLECLLADERIERIYALVRASDASAGWSRLRETASQYRVPLADSDKLTVMTGDLLAANMGLPPAEYTYLARHVDVVMHAAIAGNYKMPYVGVYRDWTLQLLATLHFCTEGRIKHLTYVGSTIARIYTEPGDFTREDSFWHCGYSQMKWINHAILGSLSDSALPVTLCQAPYLLANSRGGRDPGMRYALWQALRAARHVGVLYRGNMGSFVPVDVACRALVTNVFEDDPLSEIAPMPPVPYENEQFARLMGIELTDWAEFRARISALQTGSLGRIYTEDLPRLIELSNIPARFPASFEYDAFPPLDELMPGYLENVGLLAA